MTDMKPCLASVKRLKQEMREGQGRIMEAKRDKENEAIEAIRRLQHPRSPTVASTYCSTNNTGSCDACCSPTTEICSFGPSAYRSFRTGTREYPVSELRAKNYLYIFIIVVLNCILADDPSFPIRSTTSLWRWMKKLGFTYKRTSKVVVPLDVLFFLAAHVRFFTDIEKARSDGSKIFWHDETWCNQNEEKPFVWIDGMTGSGRLRQSKGSGK
jgi:hypothetical protein